MAAWLVQAGSGTGLPASRYPLIVDLANGTRVVGASLRSGAGEWGGRLVVRDGDTLGIELAIADGDGHAVERPVSLRLTNAAGLDWSVAEGPSGRTLSLTVPAGLPPGPYRVEATVGGGDGLPVDPVRFQRVGMLPIGGRLQLGPVLVEPSPDPLSEPVLAQVGGVLELLAAEVWPRSTAVEVRRETAGERLTSSDELPAVAAGGEGVVRTRWRGLRPLPANLRLSLHLVDDVGLVWAARDVEPTAGLYPPLLWTPAVAVEDRSTLPIPVETRPGDYRLQIGLLGPTGPLPITRRDGRTAPFFDVGGVVIRPAERIAPPGADPAWVWADLGLAKAGVGPTRLPPGGRLVVDLVWVALGRPGPLVAGLALAGPDGTHPLAPPTMPGGPAYPTEQWRPGERLRDQRLATLPRSLTAGQYQILVQLGRPSAGVGATLAVGTITVETADRRPPAPPKHPIEIRLANGIALAGYDLPAALSAGRTAIVGLHWRADRPIDHNLAVSVQLLDDGGRLVVQHDAVPQEGRAPVPGWLVDEVVLDEHPLALPPTLLPGRYRLIAVLYDPETGRRVAGDTGDSVPLGTIAVD